MNKFLPLQNLFHLGQRPARLEQEAPPTQQTIDRLTQELASSELDARFRDALSRGETTGDCVMLDKNGNEIKKAFPTKTIFDV